MRMSRLIHLAAVLLGVVVIAACSGDSSGSSVIPPGVPLPPAPPPPSPPPPPPTGPSFDPQFNPSTNLREVFYESGMTSEENGDNLESVLESLSAGDHVVIHAGTYTVLSRITFNAPGTLQDPILVEAASGAAVHINRPNANQNIVDLDSVSYLTIKDIEFSGGSLGITLRNVSYLYFYNNHVHDTGDAAITANSGNTDHLYFVDNHVHDTNGLGEGFYLGANFGAVITHHTYVIGNHVHDTGPGQGDGIEIKDGSYACVISDNLIERTNYPGILVYGTQGEAEVNLIERNVIIDSNQAGIQVAADCIVRNNLVIRARDSCIVSQPHQTASPQNLTIVHNTLVNDHDVLATSSWTGPNIVFANNAMYSDTTGPFFGSQGTAILSGNVTLGSLSAFVDLTLDGSRRDGTPSAGSALIDAGDPAYAVTLDLDADNRQGSLETGAVDDDTQ